MRVALDTNILANSEGVDGEDRRTIVGSILRNLAEAEVVIPVQALGELFTILTRQARRPAADARAASLDWRNADEVADASSIVLFDAIELAAGHQFSLRDAIMVAVAAHADCRPLLSKDMQDGFVWRGVTIRIPFLAGAVPGSQTTQTERNNIRYVEFGEYSCCSGSLYRANRPCQRMSRHITGCVQINSTHRQQCGMTHPSSMLFGQGRAQRPHQDLEDRAVCID